MADQIRAIQVFDQYSAVIVNPNPTGGQQATLSTIFVDLGTYSAAIIEIAPAGPTSTTNMPTFQVQDSPTSGGGYNNCIDSNGAITPANNSSITKKLVVNLQQFVKVQATPGLHGADDTKSVWNVFVTPISNAGTFNITGNVSTNITQVNGAAISKTNPAPVQLSDGTNSLGTAANPVVVDTTGTTRTIVYTPVSLNTSGDNTVITAPGVGKSTHIVHFELQNTSASDTTVILKDGTTAINGAGNLLGSRAGMAFDAPGGPGQGEIILGANAAFVVNLSAANQLSGFILSWNG